MEVERGIDWEWMVKITVAVYRQGIEVPLLLEQLQNGQDDVIDITEP